ncbi:Small nuclear ribonucleoprotein Sm D2, partial [Candida maltosa Xu316]
IDKAIQMYITPNMEFIDRPRSELTELELKSLEKR